MVNVAVGSLECRPASESFSEGVKQSHRKSTKTSEGQSLKANTSANGL